MISRNPFFYNALAIFLAPKSGGAEGATSRQIFSHAYALIYMLPRTVGIEVVRRLILLWYS